MSPQELDSSAKPVDIVISRQNFGIYSGRILNPLTSLEIGNIEEAIYPNSILGYRITPNGFEWVPFIHDTDGNVYIHTENSLRIVAEARQEDTGPILDKFHHETTEDILGVIGVPALPWGEDSILHLYRGNRFDLPSAFIDIKTDILKPLLEQKALIIARMMRRGRPVYWGSNNSYANIYDHPDQEGSTAPARGLMSVKVPHEQICREARKVDIRTHEQLRSIRRNQEWDSGLSIALGEELIRKLQHHPDFAYRNADMSADPMGFTFILPGFGPDKFRQLTTVDNILRPIYHNVHEIIRRWHKSIFDSELNDIIRFVQNAHQTGQFDEVIFREFFRPNPKPPDNQETTLLLNLKRRGLLRYPPGHAVSMRFLPDRPQQPGEDIFDTPCTTMIEVLGGALNTGMGPMESNGFSLTRPSTPLNAHIMKRKKILYELLTRP